jgi:PAS domain S-box-containing protein
VAVVVGYYLFWRSNAHEYKYLIEGMKEEKVVLLEKTIEFKSKNLIAYSYDYTYWDEMVEFIKNENVEWGEENINESMPTFEIDYTWIYKPNLSHLCTYSAEGVPQIDKLPFTTEELRKIIGMGKTLHFFILYKDDLIEISGASVHPTYDNKRQTPPQGYFFAGRVWTDNYLNEIGLFTESTVRLIIPENNDPKPIAKTEKFQLISTKSLLGLDNKEIAYVESVYKYTIAEKLSSENEKRIIIGTLIMVLVLVSFISFFGFKVYKPLVTLSKSLIEEDPLMLKELIAKKDEFGELASMLNKFFTQKNKLIKEIEDRNLVEKLLIKLSQAIEQSPATIIITCVNGNIEYVNPKFTKVTGYKLDEVIGKNPRFLKSGNKSDTEYRQMWETIKQGNIWRGEFSNKKKNGDIYYESVIISPIFDETGIITNYLAVNEDISEKRQEETVRNIIFEISKAGSISKSLEDLISQIRIHLSEIIDVTNFYIALYDKKSDTFSLPHFQDQKDNISTFKAAKTLTAYVLRSKKSFLGKKQDIDKLKEEGIVESIGESAEVWLGVPLMADDEAMGVFSVQSYNDENAFDEKDRGMLEFVSHEISHIIQRMKSEEEIVAALERAEQSDKLKSAFLANMSHEIRTPLNSILGFTRLMADPEIDAVKKHRFSRIINNNGSQLLSIINGLLDFSLIETGQIKLLKKSFVIEKIILEVQNDFMQTAQDKGIDIIIATQISKSETIVESDLSRLRQVISNVVDNAVKFTNSGSVELGLTHDQDSINIVVKDTGIGIPTDFWNHIFDRFQQADRTNARKFGGNGLGLAISKHIIELMGGKIWFESEVGKGSTFFIHIPYIMSTPEKYLYVKNWGN